MFSATSNGWLAYFWMNACLRRSLAEGLWEGFRWKQESMKLFASLENLAASLTGGLPPFDILRMVLNSDSP